MKFFEKYKTAFAIFAIWFVILFTVGYMSPNFKTYGPKQCGSHSYSSYYRWDSSWYTQIAERGYNYSTIKNSSIAYWPLFPFTIKILHSTGLIGIAYTSTILSFFYSLLSVLLLFKLLRFDYTKEVSKNTILVFLFFPSTYFLISGYPDSLFVFLTLASFYYSRKQQWLRAGIAGALLALTKPYGFLIIASFLFEYLIAKGWSKEWNLKKYSQLNIKELLPLFLPLVSVAGYMLFNYKKFGTPIAFLLAEKTWGRSIGNPFLALYLEAKDYITPPAKLLTGSGFPYIIYFCSFFFFLWAMYISWSRVRKSYLIFTALSMFTAFMTGTLTSWDRYMMISVASLIGVGVFLSQKKKYILPYLLLSGSTLILLASLFVRCYPVE